MNPVIVCHCVFWNNLTLTNKAKRDLFSTGMRQAFLMAESGLEAIGTPPDQPGGDVEWVFPEKETRDMAARVFGTALEVSIERKDTYQFTTTKKFSVVRGKLYRQLLALLP